jgi:DnaK suppressor protein
MTTTRPRTAPAAGQTAAPSSIGNEPYMSPRQMAHFRQLLLSQRAELSEDIERTIQEIQQDATTFADPNDRATQESDIAVELRNRDRERKLIKKITETIARIDAEDFGYCDGCGNEIGLERLEARPTATLCIECKTVAEIREKQMGG